MVKNSQESFSTKFAVIRCDDLSVIVEMDYFPDTQKAMMYRNGRKAIFLPMRNSDIMGNDKLPDELRVRASC
ncbi:hypothetical protein E6D36_09230 [Escherichia coli]|nr:hypothetical protein [Escherichia coli]EFF1059122.1 hypothetical protein [Escherichia coli]EFN8600545.1 hypothetical protein [Escherichia coli O79:H40]MKS03115.1 hypothetical protein [Escherichia coli]MWM49700.1 hypothetical protein [Escherichia coli]